MLVTDAGGEGISTHAPREGSDTAISTRASIRTNFYPRSPRGERRGRHRGRHPVRHHFYPRSPRGERQTRAVTSTPKDSFLPTLPARGATSGMKKRRRTASFLPTLPARGATAGGLAKAGHHLDFYPRSPRGERPPVTVGASVLGRFLPTLPARGATTKEKENVCRTKDFYPRSPRGERPKRY